MNKHMIMRGSLQVVVFIGSLLPIFGGLYGIIWGTSFLLDTDTLNVTLDSHFRYLSGLLLGIGIGFMTTIPNIEKHTERFRTFTAIIFLGGLARLYSLLKYGAPSSPMQLGLCMELLILPLLAFAQSAVARNASETESQMDSRIKN